MDSSVAFAKRIDSMDTEDRDHFKNVIDSLSYVYVKDGMKALIIIEDANNMVETMTINCGDMEAYEIAQSTTQFFEFVNTKDAPPKEHFN